MILPKFSSLKTVAFIAVLFYCTISIINHWCFRTFALDLGAYTSALYDYAHFQWNDSTGFKDYSENLLADHFDLYLILLSPFSLIFGVYTLLIAQIAAIIFGGIGVYRLFIKHGNKFALLAVVCFYFSFGIISAVGFDYHSNVVAACFFPWLFISYFQENRRNFIVFFILIIISRENLSLTLIFLLPTLLLLQKCTDKIFKRIVIFCTLISVFYFVIVTGIIMPALAQNGDFHQFRYSVLGKNYSEALTNLFSNPIKYIKLLFENHLPDSEFNSVKIELWIYVLLSGGVILLFNPVFFIVLMPLMAQKLYHNQVNMWGINDHYSAELCVLIVLGVFYTFSQRKLFYSRKIIFAIVVFVVTLVLDIRMMDHASSLVRRDNIRVYNKLHYTPIASPEEFKKVKNIIPDDAALSCQTLFHPHLAWRNNIYMFPGNIDKSDYILVYKHAEFWPLPKVEFEEKIKTLESDSSFEIIYRQNGFLLFKRKK